MNELDSQYVERFANSPGYRKAQRLQRVMIITTPVTLIVGVPAAHYLFAGEWALWVVALLAAAQVLAFLVAEGWKTVVFGREVFRHAREVRERGGRTTSTEETTGDE